MHLSPVFPWPRLDAARSATGTLLYSFPKLLRPSSPPWSSRPPCRTGRTPDGRREERTSRQFLHPSWWTGWRPSPNLEQRHVWEFPRPSHAHVRSVRSWTPVEQRKQCSPGPPNVEAFAIAKGSAKMLWGQKNLAQHGFDWDGHDTCSTSAKKGWTWLSIFDENSTTSDKIHKEHP